MTAADSVDDGLRALLESDDYPVADGIVIVEGGEIDAETLARWDAVHETSDAPEEADDVYTRSALALIAAAWPVCSGRFLELGCGEMRIGTRLAESGIDAYGLDFSAPALAAAAARLRRRGLPVRLVQADIRRTPFRSGAFDAIYGGGVIEHVRDLETVLQELHRITRPGGVTINTVPYLSLGALTYRQVWGNIPALPALRHVAEFVHLRLLRGRHLRFGYERSYPAWMLRRAFLRAGFVDVAISHYDVPLVFEYLPAGARPLARRLARNRLFWPMVAVVARKRA